MPGIAVAGTTETWAAVAIFGLILSIINIGIKPIMQLLSLPITVITLGIFYLVVNMLMLYIAAWKRHGQRSVRHGDATNASGLEGHKDSGGVRAR